MKYNGVYSAHVFTVVAWTTISLDVYQVVCHSDDTKKKQKKKRPEKTTEKEEKEKNEKKKKRRRKGKAKKRDKKKKTDERTREWLYFKWGGEGHAEKEKMLHSFQLSAEIGELFNLIACLITSHSKKKKQTHTHKKRTKTQTKPTNQPTNQPNKQTKNRCPWVEYCLKSQDRFGWSSEPVIERLRVRIPAGAAGEFSSPEFTLCADSYSVSVQSPCYRSGT